MGDVDNYCDEIAVLAARLDAIGCTDDEIDRVRVDQGGVLPRSVECFLRWLGRDVGGLFGGSEVGYPDVLGMKDAARQILDAYREDHVDVFQLPDDAVVISMHQGYAFEFVRCSSGENPPVEWWAEGSADPKHAGLSRTSIAEWLRADMESTVLRPRERDRHRRETQRARRRSISAETCPRCGMDLGPVIPRGLSVDPISGQCPGCGQGFVVQTY